VWNALKSACIVALKAPKSVGVVLIMSDPGEFIWTLSNSALCRLKFIGVQKLAEKAGFPRIPGRRSKGSAVSIDRFGPQGGQGVQGDLPEAGQGPLAFL